MKDLNEKIGLRIRDSSRKWEYTAFVFVLFNIVKISLFNYILIEDKKVITLGYTLFVTSIFATIIFSLLFQLKKRIVWIVFYIVQVIYIGGVICYYNYFNSILHLFQMSTLFPEGTAVVKHFSIPFYFNMLVAIIDLPLFIWLMVNYNVGSIRNSIKKRKKQIAIVCISCLFIIEMLNITRKTSLIALSIDYPKRENELVEKYGTLVNSGYDYIFNADGAGLLKSYDYGDEIVGDKTKNSPTNIVMIQVESLDANVINQVYNDKYVAENLTKYANENIYYEQMLSYHLAGGTSDAEYSTLNSVEALTSFPSMKLNSDPYLNSMPKIFSKAGYQVNAFHGNIGTFYNRTNAFKLMGFDNFYDIDEMGFTDKQWGASDGEVFDFVLNNIKRQSEPFFNYIITMTSHTPFTYVDDYEEISDFDEIESEDIRQYYKSIQYVDKQIGKFVESVRKDYPNSCIVIFGDHTPGDLKDYEKSSYIAKNEYFEFVPLIIITPEKKQYSNTEYAASFLDIAPTVLEESGLAYTIKSKGVSLLNDVKPESLLNLRGKTYNRTKILSY